MCPLMRIRWSFSFCCALYRPLRPLPCPTSSSLSGSPFDPVCTDHSTLSLPPPALTLETTHRRSSCPGLESQGRPQWASPRLPVEIDQYQ